MGLIDWVLYAQEPNGILRKRTASVENFEPEFIQRASALFRDRRIANRYFVNSGSRSYAHQAYLYALYLAKLGNLAAKPGTSDHEYGAPNRPLAKAMDINPFAGYTYKTLHAVAAEYGFEFKIPSEPWHMTMRPGRGPIPPSDIPPAPSKEVAMGLVIEPVAVVDHPTILGSGWAFGRRGHVYHVGSARHLGAWDDGTRSDSKRWCVALVPTVSGNGYYLVSNLGEVYAYGDAVATGNYRAEWGKGVIIGALPNRNQSVGGVTLIRDDGSNLNRYALPV